MGVLVFWLSLMFIWWLLHFTSRPQTVNNPLNELHLELRVKDDGTKSVEAIDKSGKAVRVDEATKRLMEATGC